MMLVNFLRHRQLALILTLISACSGCTTPFARFASRAIVAPRPHTQTTSHPHVIQAHGHMVHQPMVGVPPHVCTCQRAQHENYLPFVESGDTAAQQKTSVPRAAGSGVAVVEWTETRSNTNTRQEANHIQQVSAQASPLAIPEPIPQPVANTQVLQSVPGCGECDVFQPPPPLIHTEQINALMKRVANMEAELKRSKASIATLTGALARANQEVSKLTASVRHWRGEVARLEMSVKVQHESDIKSLNRISEMLGSLVAVEPKNAAPDGVQE